MHVCVLGAGVVGITSAYHLMKEGHRVTLVDANEPGSGASFGNGAQLSYSYVAPLAEPSVWTKWPSYLFSSDSPLTLRLQADSAQWRWLAGFLAASTRERARRTTVELLRLAFLSRDELARLRRAEPIDFLHRVAGKLVMFSDPAALASARAQVAFQARYGCRQQVLDAAGCMEIEPALAQSSVRWAGGVHTADEEVGDCALFCQALFERMRADADFRFVRGAVTGVHTRAQRLHAVQAGREEIGADAFVLALGAQSTAFAQMAGFRLPVYPLKGYSITVPLTADSAWAPSVSITDMSRKIVFARLGNRLRVAGRVELVGMDRSIPRRAIDELKAAVAADFPQCGLLDDAALAPWTGFRPATPTGLPIIGASPVPNLYLNVGHGSLGWTLACGSAAMLAAQMNGRECAIDPRPYRFASGATHVAA
ncbi:MAG TPA: D-amino acid dehydrogenase [Noviherbaspirillum sp.]|nr:D-amino acid dehydrogenase [Noviherbaspirillum sp.]